MNYWLFKSEPDAFSIDDLKQKGASPWDGVRNFKARNYMRDDAKVGDLVLFYHSSCKPPGVAGIARVSRESFPDLTALAPQSQYFDPKATKEKPIWYMVEVKFVKKFDKLIPLEQLRQEPGLEDMVILRNGNRLSITPVTKKEYETIVSLEDR